MHVCSADGAPVRVAWRCHRIFRGGRMADFRQIEQQLATTLALRHRPVAISLRDAVPDGVTKFEGTVPSGCTFWRLASEGRTFHTVPADHYNCPIGCYTHNIPLAPEREGELMQTLSL